MTQRQQITQAEWEAILGQINDSAEAAELIMHKLNGYGRVYSMGYDYGVDRDCLANALEAWAAVQHRQNRQPDPKEVARLFDEAE